MSSLSGKQGPRYRHTAGEEEPYETIAVEKLTPIIGAEISGVDLGKLVSEEARSNRQIDEIHRALAENLVIFFRDQHITDEEQLAFALRFGPMHFSPLQTVHQDAPEIVVLCYGRILATGKPDAIRRNEAVIEAYLGTEHPAGVAV